MNKRNKKKKTPRGVIFRKTINEHLNEIKHALYKAGTPVSEYCDGRVRSNNVLRNWLDSWLPRDRPALGASLAITSLVVDINHTHNTTDARYVALSNKLKCPTCAHGLAFSHHQITSPNSPSTTQDKEEWELWKFPYIRE
jgi:hypothetical protein